MFRHKSKQETLRYLELILEATEQGVCMVDEHGACTLFNRAASQMTGWRPQEVLGRNLHDLIHHTQVSGSPHPRDECPVLGVLRSGKSVHKDGDVYWRRGGTPFSVDYSSSLVSKGGRTIGVVVVFTDVTERKKAEETYRATLNILEDFDDERRNVQLVQRATLNLLEDMSDERNRLDETQRATLNILEDMNDERTKLNQTQQALMNILEDVEIERARVEQARVLLESVNRELEAFSYSVSHDLRAPLRAISGFCEATVEDYAPRLDAQGQRYLRLIQDNAHKMGQLIDDLLAFSRLGRQPMNLESIDMARLAQEVFNELAAQAPRNGLAFSLRAMPPARGDRNLIRQVLVNLLANAIKFTRPRHQARIEFGCTFQAEGSAYYVKDNGVGFDMRYVDKLFGVFQRLHSVTEFEGTGVGLALVYRIIARHGGRVWAQGQVDQGATFYFTLPQGEGR